MTTPSWDGLTHNPGRTCGCATCARFGYRDPATRAPITDEQRNAMLEGAPSWMPNEPKGDDSNA